jgi:enamine deaminase RidA (YjgF/YER057c/UK114 family)
MQTGRLAVAGTQLQYGILKNEDGQWMQFWYSITPDKPEPIAAQIKTIERAERELLDSLGIDPSTVAARKFFSSDLMTHHDELVAHKQRQATDFFMSLTDQPPAAGAKLAVLGMCLSNISERFRDGDFFYLDTSPAYRHIFAEHLIDPTADESSTAETQTANIFRLLEDRLAALGTSVRDGVLRTWIYAPHIDADYAGIVKARREHFDRIELTKDTHYIASTGIQGGAGTRFGRVCMDVYAMSGSDCGSVRYIQAPQNMSPTHVYGVTFERATAVRMGQADFLFISGTASIDSKGEIMHVGDVVRQTERTLENISAVLAAADYTKQDLASFIVYLRDAGDYAFAKPVIDQYIADLPVVYVKASVCRPGWLVEIEATAAKILP